MSPQLSMLPLEGRVVTGDHPCTEHHLQSPLFVCFCQNIKDKVSCETENFVEARTLLASCV